jgi:hypothetical protein
MLQHLLGGKTEPGLNLLPEKTDPLMEKTCCPLIDPRIAPMMSGSIVLNEPANVSGRTVRCTMRHHRSIMALVTGLFFLGLAACASEPAPSGEVQERAVPIAPLGGTVAPPPTQVNPVGFGCSATTHTCSCHGSASSIDCTMARRLVCGGEFYACPTTADPARLCCKAVK